MYQLKILLKQHTPLIHFQHTQDGATLRATEVKPKLDRFLIEQHFGGILNFDAYKQYLIGDVAGLEKEWKTKETDKQKVDWLQKQKLAFDYKLRVKKSNNIDTTVKAKINSFRKGKETRWKVDSKTAIPMVLANMADKPSEEELKNLFLYDNLECVILSYHSNLIDIINKNLTCFFAINNFGNRNNKGFGSYSVCNENGVDKTIDYLTKKSIVEIKSSCDNSKELFIAIDYIWKAIKSGINFSKCNRGKLDNTNYSKPQFFDYLNSLNGKKKNWEKAWIKETFMGVEFKGDYKPFFFRALLGLSDKFEYKGKVKYCNDKYKKQKAFYDFTISITNDDIERIKSPITFKPIKTKQGFIIYLLLDKNFSNLNVFDKPFNFILQAIKDFKLQVGFKNGKPKYEEIKPNTDFSTIDDSIVEDATFEAKKSDRKKVKNQIERLKDFCEMTQHFSTIKKSYMLNTPSKNDLDIEAFLKSEFNNKKFVARDFSGRMTINCESKIT